MYLEKRVLCYGDSNTWGCDSVTLERFDETIRYPRVLASLLGNDYDVIEEGCGGRTTVYNTDIDSYINGYTYLYPCIESHNPIDLIIIMLGTNDLTNAAGANAYYAAAGMERLVNSIRHWSIDKHKPCPQILIISPPLIGSEPCELLGQVFDYPWASAQSRLFRQYYSQIAAATDCAFLASEDYAVVNPVDNIHITPESHQTLANAIYKKVLELLA